MNSWSTISLCVAFPLLHLHVIQAESFGVFPIMTELKMDGRFPIFLELNCRTMGLSLGFFHNAETQNVKNEIQ